MKSTLIFIMLLFSLRAFSQDFASVEGQDNENEMELYEHPSHGLAETQSMFLIALLKTCFNEQGIYYQYLPIHFKTHLISWEQVDSAYVRKYNPIFEYGGWGIKGHWGHGQSLSAWGNKGVQLVLKNGKRLLIGTHRPQELAEYLMALSLNGKVKTS